MPPIYNIAIMEQQGMMVQPAVMGGQPDLLPKPDNLQYDPSVYKKNNNGMASEKTGTIMNAIGQGLQGLGTVFTGIFGGGSAAPATGSVYSVPVQVGVDTGTKKWITYAGIAGGVLLLVLVLIMAFKKK